ncbi:MAG: hypothetical protein QOF40_2905, partial [Actinomycetota bacterium]|nr:hypothetical protein [Actinomycetota bacterium]
MTDLGPVERAAEPPESKPTKRWQKVVSVVLLVIGFILVPLSGIAIWSHNQLTNTDRYVETVSPLAENKDIQQAVASRVVTALFSQVDVAKQVEDALPSRAKFLGQPIATATKTYATGVTEKLLASKQFDTLWDNINRRAHDQLVALLTDDSAKAKGAVSIKDGKVSLDLGSVIARVQAKLVAAGLTFLEGVHVPPVSRTIDIINTEGLAEARSYLAILDTLAWVLPVLAIAALVGSALVVRTRRRATISAALVLVSSCAFTLALLAIGRSLYLDAASSPNVSKGAAEA